MSLKLKRIMNLRKIVKPEPSIPNLMVEHITILGILPNRVSPWHIMNVCAFNKNKRKVR